MLRVGRGASAKEVQRAYLRLSLLVHPDKCGHPRAAEAFAVLTDAREALAKVQADGSMPWFGAQSPAEAEEEEEQAARERSEKRA